MSTAPGKVELSQRSVEIPPSGVRGDLITPANPQGIIVFAHGSGSSRLSPRNRFVAAVLQQGSLATLLLDLLTEQEEQLDLQTRELRFDINLLSNRLIQTGRWLQTDAEVGALPLGLFGASTGTAAALIASTEIPQAVRAIVSRGGRPDLAGTALRKVNAPTLLVVGSEDHRVIELNKKAMNELACEKKLEIVPGATHLFEEAGTLEKAARLANDWFQGHLST